MTWKNDLAQIKAEEEQSKRESGRVERVENDWHSDLKKIKTENYNNSIINNIGLIILYSIIFIGSLILLIKFGLIMFYIYIFINLILLLIWFFKH